MFQDLDNSLVQLLDDPAAPAELRAAQKSFETPDKNYAPSAGTLNLFLFEVGENRELRNAGMLMERQGSMYVRRKPPIRANCSYMVTAWSSGVGAQMVDTSHQLLGEAFEWLSGFQVIPLGYLQGSLIGQRLAPPAMAAQLDGNKVFGEFWTALGSPPRPAFLLTVTIAMDVSEPANVAPVATRQMNIVPSQGATSETLLAVAGRVYQVAAGQDTPINGAYLTIDGALRQVSDVNGLYTFPKITGGTHTLQCVAQGFQPVSQTINVPGVLGEYDLALVPL